MPPLSFFTICSKNFLAYARTLAASVREQHPGARVYLALCDRLDDMVDPANEPFELLPLESLSIPGIEGMIERYNITELNTSIKPFVFEHLFAERGESRVVYLDPDILVVSPLADVDARLGADIDAVLTPHVLDPAEDVEIDDVKMLLLGTFNLGFIALHDTPRVRAIVAWWGRRLREQCVIDVPNGLFVDQKWADLLPALIPRTLVLHHPGYNVAYWNLPQRRVAHGAGGWTVNGQPLVFAHFSGNDLDNPAVFSRHSPRLAPEVIGEAAALLAEYRTRVFAQGHAHYRQLPYAFRWNGASGRNEHTPEPVRAVPAHEAHASAPPVDWDARLPARRGLGTRARDAWTTLARARRHAGGWGAMVAKAAGVVRRGGMPLVRDTIRNLNLIYPAVHRGDSDAPVPVAEYRAPVAAPASQGPEAPRRGKVLFIDWSTPRPDCDAGSITAFYLMKILVDIGYDVVFAPDDMLRLGHYSEALEGLGIRCLSAGADVGLGEHLAREGGGYDVVLVCRAPFARKWLDAIRRHAPQASVVLNTADLYFLRDIREAELEGDAAKLEAALRWKEEELDVINRCDHCIVMSDHELAILRREAPHARVHLVPLMFVDIPGRSRGAAGRKDLLFIGGYLHKPNEDGAVWFCREVWPAVRAALPDARLALIGSNVTDPVKALADLPGVEVVGFAADLAPWFDGIRLSIAPLRFGAGIKGKLGTSLSYGVPSVATSIAVEGMHLEDGTHVLVGDDPSVFAEQVVRLYTDDALWERLSTAGLDFVRDRYSLDAGLARVSAFMDEVDAGRAAFPCTEVHDDATYAGHLAGVQGALAWRGALERRLVPDDEQPFTVRGHCALCDAVVDFGVDFTYELPPYGDGRRQPNWREHLACPQCGLNNRMRAALHAFRAIAAPAADAEVYITEQTTPLFQWLLARYPRARGSEFLGDRVPRGEDWNGLRNEDLMALTWGDASFDHVLSFDVLEHIHDPLAGLRECHRVLRPGSTLLWSAPVQFAADGAMSPRNVIRAVRAADGAITHLMPPEYHGNPVDPDAGALCFHYFGFEALEQMRAAGFEDARFLFYWSSRSGYLGGQQVLCMARKPAA